MNYSGSEWTLKIFIRHASFIFTKLIYVTIKANGCVGY